MSPRTLLVIACGCPPTRDLGKLITLAQGEGWITTAMTTPNGRAFADIEQVATHTGYPVLSTYRQPHEPKVAIPAPDAIVVTPATVNTVNKFAAGICDNLALGTLAEALGRGLPIVMLPFSNTAHIAHPAFGRSVTDLRGWGVTVLLGDDVYPLHDPGSGGRWLPGPFATRSGWVGTCWATSPRRSCGAPRPVRRTGCWPPSNLPPVGTLISLPVRPTCPWWPRRSGDSPMP